MVTIQKIVKDLMNEYDLNQQEFAERFGMSKSTVSRYLSGKSTPSLSDYMKLYNEWEKFQPICKMF